MMCSSPNVAAGPGPVPHPSSPGRTTRASVAAASASNKGSFSGFASPLLRPVPCLPKGDCKIQIVDTGAYKIRLKTYSVGPVDGRPAASTGPIRKTEVKKSMTSTSVNTVPIMLPLTDDDEFFDEDVVMKSTPSPEKSKYVRQPIATPSSPKKSPRTTRKVNTPGKLSSDDKLLVNPYRVWLKIYSLFFTFFIFF